MLPEKSQARRGKSQSQRRLSKGILRYLFLEEKNKKNNPTDFDAFLWSRWIVCCIATRKIFSIFSIRLKWYKPTVVFKAAKLLIYK